MQASQNAADDPDRKQCPQTHPQAKSASELHVACSHESRGIEEKQKTEACCCAEQSRGPVVPEWTSSQRECRECENRACEHKPIRDAALLEIIDGDKQ